MGDSFDLVVIGGGVSGLGVALEAAKRGLTVCLFERGACGQGTSANSLRIMHGGLRYLQTLDIRRTIESEQAQSSLLRDFPEYIRPLRFIMPFNGRGLSRAPFGRAAIYLYRLLSGMRRDWESESVWTTQQVEAESTYLKGKAPLGALTWTEGYLVHPDQFIENLVECCTVQGVDLHQGVSVVGIAKSGSGYDVYSDRGGSRTVSRAKSVVNAAGPSVKSITRDFSTGLERLKNSWCRAFNVIVDCELEAKFGLGMRSDKGRLLFAVPRSGATALGTGYLPLSTEKPHSATIAGEEILEFLTECNQAFLGLDCGLNRVLRVESGIMPLASFRDQQPEFYGSSVILKQERYIEILSTKYTTFRAQAKQVIDQLESEIKESAPAQFTTPLPAAE